MTFFVICGCLYIYIYSIFCKSKGAYQYKENCSATKNACYLFMNMARYEDLNNKALTMT